MATRSKSTLRTSSSLPRSRWESPIAVPELSANQDTQANTEGLFSWQGPPVFTIAGLHKFRIEPTKDGAATIFTQSEELKGLMAWLMGPSLLGKKMKAHFDEFHRDLKARAEAS
jgi:hypothetical protein